MSVHPAVRQARNVVGLYGDPTVTWSIALGVELQEPLTCAAVAERAAHLWPLWSHLGPLPQVERARPDDWTACRARLLDTPYGDCDPLVRIALSSDGHQLLVAVHHGAVDGLGMVGLVGALTGVELTSSARGIAAASEPRGFWRRSLERVAEAVFRPPARLGPTRRVSQHHGDWVEVLVLPQLSGGTTRLVAAVTRAGTAWRGRTRRRTVISLALSTRPGAPRPSPDRATAYGRIVVPDGRDDEVAARLRALVPEPAFPQTTAGGVGPLVTKLLSSRLGATALVSNIGRLSGDGLVGAQLWPAPSGPAGVAIGAVTVGERSTVTVRMRRGWFDAGQATAFAGALGSELVEPTTPTQ